MLKDPAKVENVAEYSIFNMILIRQNGHKSDYHLTLF